MPIHKIHLIFGKHNSFDLLKIFEKFKININFNKNIYTTFKKQKNFLDKKNLISENNKKIFLKTLLNNLDQKNSKFVKNIFNHCFTEKKKEKIFKNFYMNKKDIMVLDKLGMRIGGHGYGHKVLSKLTYNQQIIDISKSLNLLSNIIKKKIDIFCYPYGGFEVFNKDTIKILNKKKIIYSFNVDSKDWTLKSNKLYVPRYDCNEFKYGKIFKLN